MEEEEGETLSREHANARKAYMYAFALLEGVGDLRLMDSRMHLDVRWVVGFIML